MESSIILLIILAISIIGRADSVAVATCILLLLKLLHIDNYIFPFVEKSGLFCGLVLLISAILIPIANGKITYGDLSHVFSSPIGILALILSFLTTYLSGLGVRYLTVQGHGDVMAPLILGAVISAAFLGGVPVGPFITSGILAAIFKLYSKYKQ